MNHPPAPDATTSDARQPHASGGPRVRLQTTGLVALGVVGFDIATKDWVLRTIGPTERIHLVGTFSFVRRFNTGAAFSFGNGSRATAWLVTVVVAVVLVTVTRHLLNPPANSPVTNDRRWWWVLGLIVGGAIGNQLDRLFRGAGWNRGAVVDFIDPGFFPIFNIADSALTVGCIIAAVLSLLAAPGPQQHSSPQHHRTGSSEDELIGPEPSGAQTAQSRPTPTQVSVANSVTPTEEPNP